MPETTLLLVRHGQTDWNRLGRYQGQQDSTLNDTGRQQAALLAAALAATSIDATHCSDLSRAHETARIVLAGRDVPLHVSPAWREIALGVWEGLYIHEVRERWPDQYQAWQDAPHSVSIEGGETLEQVRLRAVSALDQLLADNVGKTLLLVSHNAVIRVLLCDVLGLPLTEINRVRSSSTGISIVRFSPQPSLVLMNSVSHLGVLTEDAAQATA